MALLHAILTLSLGLGPALAAPSQLGLLSRQDVINHDAVVGFPEMLPDGVLGELYQRFKPLLFVDTAEGCVPFPAVDRQGNIGGGLQATGPPGGKCSRSVGQTYVRSKVHELGHKGARFGMMFAWYFPKTNHHRHDWQSAVLWVTNKTTDAYPISAFVSQHRHYVMANFKERHDNPNWNGTHPILEYRPDPPWNHVLDFTELQTEAGFTKALSPLPPMIDWDCLTDTARTQLNYAFFDKATVPFRDDNFAHHFDMAWGSE